MKARLPMLLLAAVAALALVSHKGPSPSLSPPPPTVSATKPAAPAQEAKPPVLAEPKPRGAALDDVILAHLDDPTTPDDFPIPRPFAKRPQAPVFTDIGQQADVATSHFGASDPNIESQLVQKEIVSQVPLAGTIFAVTDMLLGGGNAAGLSPQQMAFIAKGGSLAVAEGRLGAKHILINGEYVLVGGAGLGGPGLADAEAAVLDEQRSLGAAPARVAFG